MTADLDRSAASSQAVVIALAALLLGLPAASAQERVSPPGGQVKIAARSLDAESAGSTLGRPVIVTRADVESPLGRVRGLEPDSDTSGQLRLADPAFKAVLLTPRESTGRPAQPMLPDVVLTEPEAPPPAEPGAKQKDGTKLQSHLSDPAAPSPDGVKERATPRPSSQQPKRAKEAAATTPARATAPPPRAPVRNAAGTPAPRFGAAEIAATRAFTRF